MDFGIVNMKLYLKKKLKMDMKKVGLQEKLEEMIFKYLMKKKVDLQILQN
jgi:hypothetical protein